MNFPIAGAQVYYNEAGEPLGWDIPSDDPPDVDGDFDSYVPEDDDDEDQAVEGGYFSRETGTAEAEAEADLWPTDLWPREPRPWRR